MNPLKILERLGPNDGEAVIAVLDRERRCARCKCSFTMRELGQHNCRQHAKLPDRSAGVWPCCGVQYPRELTLKQYYETCILRHDELGCIDADCSESLEVLTIKTAIASIPVSIFPMLDPRDGYWYVSQEHGRASIMTIDAFEFQARQRPYEGFSSPTQDKTFRPHLAHTPEIPNVTVVQFGFGARPMYRSTSVLS